MRIVLYDVGGSGSKGAVHELVVVGVGGDEIPMEVRVYALHILAFQNGVHHIPRNLGRGHAPYDFLIFLKDFRRYTERVTAVKEASSHRICFTVL